MGVSGIGVTPMEAGDPGDKSCIISNNKRSGSLINWVIWTTWLSTGCFHEYQRLAGNMEMDKPN